MNRLFLIMFSLLAPLSANEAPEAKELYLSENFNNGREISLSDGSIYEVAPEDWIAASAWLVPFPITITDSGDPNYPLYLINSYNGDRIKVKRMQPNLKG